MEIERKFAIAGFPDLAASEMLDQWQGYLCTAPEVRIRHTNDRVTGEQRYVLCVKSVGDLVRHEVETALTEAQFQELQSMLEYPLIHKEYRAYWLPDGHKLECSRVDDGAFSYAEVEFQTEEEAKAWTPPAYLGREMTYDSRFRMRTYWSDRSTARYLSGQEGKTN